MAVKRRGGFVQDYQMQGSFGNREGAGHLNHLPFPDREIADDSIEGDAVTRKNFIEFAVDQPAGSLSPTPSDDVWMQNAGVLSHRQIRAKRQFLENAPDSQSLCKKRRMTLLSGGLH